MSASPAHVWVPAHKSSNGDLAAEFGRELGLTPDDDQRAILDAIYAETKPGVPACFETAIIAPRQNLKTATLIIAALADVFVFGAERVIWTAHLFDTAQDAFKKMRLLLGRNDDLKSQLRWPPRTANGDEAIELRTGQSIEFHARSRGGGRGFDGDVVVLDEGLFLSPDVMGALVPVLATREGAQIRYASSAGLATSDVLRDVRDRGRAGGDSDLAYFEYCAPVTACEREECMHLLGTSGCALDREDLRAQANPALGRRISRKRLSQFRRSMPPTEFAREFLGWWDEPAAGLVGIPEKAWNDRQDVAGDIAANPAITVDVSLDRTRTSVGVAGMRDDGRIQIELVEYELGTAWAVGRLAEMYNTWGVPVTLDRTGPAAALIPDLDAAGIPINALERAQVVQACGAMFDAVTEGTVVHLGDPALTQAVLAARLRTGEAYVFTRKGDSDISPLYAVTLARWIAATAPDYDLLDSVY